MGPFCSIGFFQIASLYLCFFFLKTIFFLILDHWEYFQHYLESCSFLSSFHLFFSFISFWFLLLLSFPLQLPPLFSRLLLFNCSFNYIFLFSFALPQVFHSEVAAPPLEGMGCSSWEALAIGISYISLLFPLFQLNWFTPIDVNRSLPFLGAPWEWYECIFSPHRIVHSIHCQKNLGFSVLTRCSTVEFPLFVHSELSFPFSSTAIFLSVWLAARSVSFRKKNAGLVENVVSCPYSARRGFIVRDYLKD